MKDDITADIRARAIVVRNLNRRRREAIEQETAARRALQERYDALHEKDPRRAAVRELMKDDKRFRL